MAWCNISGARYNPVAVSSSCDSADTIAGSGSSSGSKPVLRKFSVAAGRLQVADGAAVLMDTCELFKSPLPTWDEDRPNFHVGQPGNCVEQAMSTVSMAWHGPTAEGPYP